MNKLALVPLLAALALSGCNPGQPSGGGSSASSVRGTAAPLSDSDFNAMSAEQQYQVVSKLLGTLYKGMPVDEFFDVSAGFDDPQVAYTNALARIRQAIAEDMPAAERDAIDRAIDGIDSEGNPNEELNMYTFDGDRPRALPLARMHEYPLSRDAYINWMAYFLANTIMYSPALEMESTDIVNVQNIVRRLVEQMTNGLSVRQMVRSQLPTIDRWRVSRSAENHALEAYELYLGLFDTEEDSRRGGIACKDLYLTDEDQGYQLARTDFPNYEEQLILDNYYVMTCDDLHDVIAGHPLLLPRVTEVIINYLMDGRTIGDRLAMVESIVGSGADTFEEIFTAILFSREYLLNTERPRSFEETTMSLLATLKWDPRFNEGIVDERIFDNMTSSEGGAQAIYLGTMGWHSMALKIGRTPFVPMDALSFANYHKGLREQLLRRSGAYTGEIVTVGRENLDTGEIDEVRIVVPGLILTEDTDADPGDVDTKLQPYLADIRPQDYLNLLFLSTLHRRADSEEMADLMTLFEDDLNFIRDDDDDGDLDVRTGFHDDIARETFDYASRLPEFYYVKSIN